MAKKSLKDRLADKKKELASRGSGNSKLIFLKEGTLRCRILPVGEDNDFILDAQYFYFGKDQGGFVSPSTIGKECPATKLYEALKSSSDENKGIAKDLAPKKKGMIFVATYKDDAGKQIDTDNSEKFVLLSNSLQQEIIDYYLDSEWGDMTDPEDGYDLKLKREGSGKMDTTYSCSPAKNSKLQKPYSGKTYDLESQLNNVIPSYEEILEKIETKFGMSYDELMEAIDEGETLGGSPSGKKSKSDLDDDDDEKSSRDSKKKKFGRK